MTRLDTPTAATRLVRGRPRRSPAGVPPADPPSGSRGLRRAIRWAVALVIVGHGLVHLVGGSPAWVAAGALVATSGVLLAADVGWWWTVALAAALTSQTLIASSWDEAAAGTAGTVLLVVAAAHGFASHGPFSLRTRYRRTSTQTLTAAAAAESPPPVSDADLSHLPAPVAAYVARCGAVGRPRVAGFRARIHGRIRAGADAPWMEWTGEQANSFGEHPTRLLFMDATMKGMPADVLHTYLTLPGTGPSARMQVRPLSLLPLIDATGPDMTQAETVTLLNDLCVLAPAALVDAPIRWVAVDEQHCQATWTVGTHSATATLVFDDEHRLVDFVSDDRLRASPDGRSFNRQRWSTPVGGYRTVDGRALAGSGLGRWHPEPPESAFDYLEFQVDDITYLEP